LLRQRERERERERERKRGEREKGGRREQRKSYSSFWCRASSHVPLALTLKAPSLARIYSTRKWREREGARNERTVKQRKTLFSVV